eukprot:CAMPEP_0119312112 /NCGR_PEP_ID=MMETSP1333-20130426/25088_1 /TAXON_ID=418940 /ORGANISM="Scyphosphaera apsteinii, Strain RCC1455" /LENGTH=341 /DNA_ID=CAMNT_0007316673 /DNA_START=179 /DNA_END=1204 /DNA_ORIENTATION=+
MAESIIVTDGTDSFYGSRSVFQYLHDFGDYSTITACSTSVSDAKKMLLSRQARYSGLIDVLQFTEDDLGNAMVGATVWLTVNANESQLSEQLAKAQAAGIKRVFILISADGPSATLDDSSALQNALETTGMTYTVMRTGKLVADGAGGGLKICDIADDGITDVSKEDVFRFITEALTLDGANGRMLSLVSSIDESQLKEMRLAGCDRREEVEALLAGVITEKSPEEEAGEIEAAKEEESKSEAEDAADREEELKALLARARQRGLEDQKKRKEEEDEKMKLREERSKYFTSESGDDESSDAADKPSDGNEPPPPPPPAPPSSGGDKPPGDGGSDEPPLALA